MRALAVWLGRADGAALRAELRARRAEVRAVFDKIITPAGKKGVT
jgi:hypothetical protein